MGRSRGRVQAIIHVNHQQVGQYLVDYNFGRLSPALSAGVEHHIRTCELCQRQGLQHAETDMHAAKWRFKHLRPARKSWLARGRYALPFVLLIVVLAGVGISAVHHDPFYIATMLGARGYFPSPNRIPSRVAQPQPTPGVLSATVRFETSQVQAAAIAVSPDGKHAAVAGVRLGVPAVVIYDAVTGTAQARLSWQGQDVPGALAWSSSGDALAASDGSMLAIWQMPGHSLQLAFPVLQDAGLRVYDASTGAIAHTLSAQSAFAGGTLLRWGADGALGTAPTGAATSVGVAQPGTPLIGLWQVSGSHVYVGSNGSLVVGYQNADHTHGLLSWSPDGNYVVWGRYSHTLASNPGTGASTASVASDGVPSPDSVVDVAASQLTHTGHGDLLIWFSPDGKSLAMCNRSAKGAALSVYSIDTGRIISVLPNVCDSVSLTSFSWMPPSRAFLLALPGHAIAVYPITSAA